MKQLINKKHMTFLTNGYFERLFFYVDSFQELMKCYKYGILNESYTVLFDVPNEEHRFNISLNYNDITVKQIGLHSFHPVHFIPPERIIHAFDYKDKQIINRSVPKECKMKYLYHGTPIINLQNILLDKRLRLSNGVTGRYVYGHDQSMKSRCLYYGGENCAILEIDTSDYEVINLLLIYEYGIPVDVSIFDVNSIEFYLKKELICKWNRETILEKVRAQEHNNTGIRIFSRGTSLNDDEVYSIYNKLIL